MNPSVSMIGRYLLELARSGQISPGDRMPSERELSQRLGICRQALREGIAHFEAKGIITRVRSVGSFVSPNVHLLSILPIVAATEGQTDEVRHLLEPDIAAIAARRASRQHLARLGAAVAAMAEAGDGDAFRLADLEFHLALVEAGGNPILSALMRVQDGSTRPCICRYNRSALQPLVTMHRNLYQAVRSGKSEKARCLVGALFLGNLDGSGALEVKVVKARVEDPRVVSRTPVYASTGAFGGPVEEMLAIRPAIPLYETGWSEFGNDATLAPEAL